MTVTEEIRRTHAAYVTATGENVSYQDYVTLRELWESMGGHFYGPNVEHGAMPESRLLPMLRRWTRRLVTNPDTKL